KNDAPVLTGANNFPSILEDEPNNFGIPVFDLINGHVTDPDDEAQTGVAITAVDTTNGVWQFSGNAGLSWTNIGNVSPSSALLLTTNENAALRFVPNSNFNGTVTNGITFRAWDRTSGAEGSLANTSANGGTTAFSTATASSSITVLPVND